NPPRQYFDLKMYWRQGSLGVSILGTANQLAMLLFYRMDHEDSVTTKPTRPARFKIDASLPPSDESLKPGIGHPLSRQGCVLFQGEHRA
ncbi:MAG: hypothetical protein AAB285_09315, partial [candidate division NC10 bacterium]